MVKTNICWEIKDFDSAIVLILRQRGIPWGDIEKFEGFFTVQKSSPCQPNVMPSAAISIVQIMPSSPLFPSAKLGKTPHWAGTFILLPIKFYTTEQINVLCLTFTVGKCLSFWTTETEHYKSKL
jgi:hypothetical protein